MKGAADFLIQGPLFDLPKWIPQSIRFDSMHVLCLGIDLLVAGNIISCLLTYDFWGDGDDTQKLLVGWQQFRQWARLHHWQPLVWMLALGASFLWSSKEFTPILGWLPYALFLTLKRAAVGIQKRVCPYPCSATIRTFLEYSLGLQ